MIREADGEITDYAPEPSPLFIDSEDSGRRFVFEETFNMGEEGINAIIMSSSSFSRFKTPTDSFHRDFASP